MTRAYIHTVLPSQANLLEDHRDRGRRRHHRPGPVHRDQRQPGARATARPAARVAERPDRHRVDTFDFEVVADELFTPLLAYNAMLNTLFTHSREVGSATYVVRGRAKLAGHPPAAFEETFSGNAATVMAALYVAGPLTALLDNGFEPVTIEGIDVSITAYDDVRSAELERVWLDDHDRARVTPSRSVSRCEPIAATSSPGRSWWICRPPHAVVCSSSWRTERRCAARATAVGTEPPGHRSEPVDRRVEHGAAEPPTVCPAAAPGCWRGREGAAVDSPAPVGT